MPYLSLITNVKIEQSGLEGFVLEFSKLSAEILKKPEVYISVSYTHNPTLTFNGTLEPAFQLHITSLGNINPEANIAYSKAFFGFLGDKLKINDKRGYITFYDPGREYLGFNSTTFGTL